MTPAQIKALKKNHAAMTNLLARMVRKGQGLYDNDVYRPDSRRNFESARDLVEAAKKLASR